MKKVIFLFLLLFHFLFLSYAQDEGEAVVAKIIEGDTLKLENAETIRLIGINAPELKDTRTVQEEAKILGQDPWAYRTLGGDAFNAVKKIIEEAEMKIRFESDIEPFDETGNLLAYIYVPVEILAPEMTADDEVYLKKNVHYEIFLNGHLVKIGLAQVVVHPANTKYQGLLFRLEQEAKQKKLGIWKHNVDSAALPPIQQGT